MQMQPTPEQQPLDQALAELQATASNFARSCIRESGVRAQYIHDIGSMSREIEVAVKTGRLSAQAGATQAQELRNAILDLSRTQSSPIGRAYAMKLKIAGRTFAEVAERNAQKLFKAPFATLSEAQQAAVHVEMIRSAGRGDPRVVALAQKLGRVGRRVLLVSLAVALYEIQAADNKPREVLRQGTLAGAGIAGGALAGSGAVAAGLCAATAPVCAGIAALIGGLLFAFGADIGFGALYPSPARR